MSILSVEDQLARLLDLLLRMIESVDGDPITVEGDEHAQTLATKVFCHLGTALHLMRGTSLPPLTFVPRWSYCDVGAMGAVVRTALESYIAFCFIYAWPEDGEQRRLRLLAWKLGTLRMRQRFPEPELPESHAKLESERPVIAAIEVEMRSNPHFQWLTSSVQERVLDGDWRGGRPWHVLAEKHAWLPKIALRECYRVLSTFAHPEFLSVLQLEQSDEQGKRELATIVLNQARMVASHLAFAYPLYFKPARSVFASAAERPLASDYCLSMELQLRTIGVIKST